MMFVITRKAQQAVTIRTPNGDEITIKLIGVEGRRAKLGVEAPDRIAIHPSENAPEEPQIHIEVQEPKPAGRWRKVCQECGRTISGGVFPGPDELRVGICPPCYNGREGGQR